ncbi:DUF885 domain-containing protein [Glaciecola sp. 2405UD65-10]|uniref:DUF885 domain-containing protein n=1 Tax=Glaciecola sp. 2405UD65-10 TaxID=3397244 RepID=UPI003B5C5C55
MSFKLTLVAGAVMLLTACSNESETTNTQNTPLPSAETAPMEVSKNASEKANQLFDELFEESIARSPQWLTALGRKADNDKWNDISDQAAKETQELAIAQLAKLNAIDAPQLDDQTQTSLMLFKQKLENQIADYKWRLHTYPVNQMYALHAGVPTLLLNQHRIDSEADAQAYIARLNALPAYFAQIIDALKLRAENGVITPKFVFAHVMRTGENIVQGAPLTEGDDNTVFADFKRKVDALFEGDDSEKAQQKKAELIAQAEQAMLESFKPAYANLQSYLSELEKQADTKDGAWKLPNGDEFYKVKLQRTTTTDLTAQEIHQIGLDEVARIHDEMREIKNKVNFEGDLRAFMDFMKTDSQFYYPNTEEGKAQYLAEATAYIDTMMTRLDELFITKPKAPLEVRAVEAFREQSAGKAFYNQPSQDGSRPGIYYANLYDMEAMPTYQMEALAYHEGAPGHHMQIALQQELENMPMFRKFGRYTAYTEGWGLYTEYMPKEIGMYSDPYSDFGRLAMELWRACRLVVDTGIHAMKWTRQEGIDYYVDNTPNAKSDAVKMVERHIVMPSQATAYKIGMLKILELRADAKEKLQDKFDIREFHEVVLQNGPVPLNVLEANVNAWVEQTL